MRILYVAHRIPFPPNKGDKIRSFHEIKYLSQRHEIHLLAFHDDPADAHCGRDLEEYCCSVTPIALDRSRQMARAVTAMLTGKPWTLGFYGNHAMCSAVRRVFEDTRIDVAFAFSSSMAPYIASLPCRRVIDFVDSDAAKWHQYSEVMPFPKSCLYRYESSRLSAFEVEMIRTLDASVFISPLEVSWIDQNGAYPPEPALAERLHFISNGIDLDYYQPRSAQPADPTIIFTGAMDYFPNIDAVQFFARSVFPLVRSKVPAARFLIVGSKPAPAVLHMSEIAGVTVTGTVPDVRPYLAQARVAAVPLRVSQGIQNKVLEALASGLPVVTTPRVADGLAHVDRLPVAVESTPQAIADRVVKYLIGPAQTETQISITRSVLAEHYSWAANLSLLEHLLS